MTVSRTAADLKKTAAILGVIVAALAVLAGAAGFVSYISKSEIGTALQKPLERLSTVEENTKNIPKLESTLRETENTVIRLQTTVEVYFGKQPLDKKSAEIVTGRAVDRALVAKNPSERKAALDIASDVLERTASHHVVLDYKKISKYGLSLLEQTVEGSDELKTALSKLARQRTLGSPPPEAVQPSDSFIVDKEQRLDGTSFKNVTFVNCRILYDDGWLNLENVRFINCTFDVSLRGGKEFYRGLFKSEESVATVSVKSPGLVPKKQSGS